jgi:hypothetical protein
MQIVLLFANITELDVHLLHFNLHAFV